MPSRLATSCHRALAGVLVLGCALFAGGAGTGCSSGEGCLVKLEASLDPDANPNSALCLQFGSAAEQSMCAAMGGTPVSSCPTGDVTGTCDAVLNGESVTTTYYGGPPEADMTRCEALHGTPMVGP